MAIITQQLLSHRDPGGKEITASVVYDDTPDRDGAMDILGVRVSNSRASKSVKVELTEGNARKTAVDTRDGLETDVRLKGMKATRDREGVLRLPFSIGFSP